MAKLTDYIRRFRGKGIYPRLIGPEEFHRIMVIAPHPDDDVIGLGGLMALRAMEVAEVVYVTDGAKGDPGREPEETISIRREEAVEAATILGVGKSALRFLDFPDGNLENSEVSRGAILSAIGDVRPESIFVPFFTDNHPDHTAVVKIVSCALEDLRIKLDVWCYETWSALVPNHLIDITHVIGEKLRAIGTHRSQIAYIDYREKIKGLNAFRSLSAGREVEYAEAFYRCAVEDFISFSKVLT